MKKLAAPLWGTETHISRVLFSFLPFDSARSNFFPLVIISTSFHITNTFSIAMGTNMSILSVASLWNLWASSLSWCKLSTLLLFRSVCFHFWDDLIFSCKKACTLTLLVSFAEVQQRQTLCSRSFKSDSNEGKMCPILAFLLLWQWNQALGQWIEKWWLQLKSYCFRSFLSFCDYSSSSCKDLFNAMLCGLFRWVGSPSSGCFVCWNAEVENAFFLVWALDSAFVQQLSGSLFRPHCAAKT